jgi:peptidoglycan-N-acetylglucosamine deacetylase
MPVALSFDDGPHPDWTPKILDALDEADAKATFFVVGELAARHKDIVRDEFARGHQVQPHCWSHSRGHHQMKPDEIDDDITKTLGVLQSLGAPTPRLWRPVGGETKPPYTEKIAAAHNLELIRWDVDVRDFDPKQTADAMLQQIRTGQPQPGWDQPRPLTEDSVVLMHDGLATTDRTTCESTVDLIGPLAGIVRERGGTFRFV